MVAVARVVSVAAFAAGVWASGVAVLGPFSGVASLRDFGVSRGLSLTTAQIVIAAFSLTATRRVPTLGPPASRFGVCPRRSYGPVSRER